MNNPSVVSLQKEFNRALHSPSHPYLGQPNHSTIELKHCKQKTIRLAEVYSIARHQIESAANQCADNFDKLEKIALVDIRKHIDSLYDRYQKSTRSWKRKFLKILAKHAPKTLKKIFPVFSNRIIEAEERTRREFNLLCAFIDKKNR